MFETRSPIEHLLEFPPKKCRCIVCRYMQMKKINEKNDTKIEDFI